jgi:ferredoxin
MMRVRVDQVQCQGHARCWEELPNVFTLDEAGYCAITEADIAPEDEAGARRAAAACPERAITLVDDDN